MRAVEIINDFSKANPLSLVLILLAFTTIFVVIVKRCNDKINGVK